MLAPGTILSNRYRIEGLLGKGGMGHVFRAQHLVLEQPVAIKILSPAGVTSSKTIGRFVREARAAARLQSEHVARVYDAGATEDHLPYIVMELLDGTDLAKQLSDAKEPLPVSQAVDLVLEALDAVAEAHAIGIVHRDLKPHNLILARRVDGSKTLKVVDFGISKAELVAGVVTTTGEIMGSPAYMSPEQIESSHDVGPTADIWSIGVVLYELLTEQQPFFGVSAGQVLARVMKDEPPRPSQWNPKVSEELERVIAKCMRKRPDERYQSAGALAEALALRYEPNLARGRTREIFRRCSQQCTELTRRGNRRRRSHGARDGGDDVVGRISDGCAGGRS